MKLKIVSDYTKSNKTVRFVKEILRDRKLDDEYDTESEEELSSVENNVIEILGDTISQHEEVIDNPPQDGGEDPRITIIDLEQKGDINYRLGGLEDISRSLKSNEITPDVIHDIEESIYSQKDEQPPISDALCIVPSIRDVIDPMSKLEFAQSINSNIGGSTTQLDPDGPIPMNQSNESVLMAEDPDFQIHKCIGLGGEIIEVSLPHISREKIMNILMLLSIYFIDAGKFRIVDDHVESDHRGYILCDYIVNRSFHTSGRFLDRVSRFRL
jgi:hypothetical protein